MPGIVAINPRVVAQIGCNGIAIGVTHVATEKCTDLVLDYVLGEVPPPFAPAPDEPVRRPSLTYRIGERLAVQGVSYACTVGGAALGNFLFPGAGILPGVYIAAAIHGAITGVKKRL